MKPSTNSVPTRSSEYLTYQLDRKEVNELSSLADDAIEKYNCVTHPEFQTEYTHYTSQLSLNLRRFLSSFRLTKCDFYLLKGLDIDNGKLGSTPTHWQEQKSVYVRKLQFIHYIIAASVAQPFGWKTQQNGHLVSDVLPIAGFEKKQQGFGSKAGLRFHTEDPFHMGRPDYITLMCMRNHQATPTTLFPVNLSEIPDQYKSELFKTQFEIVPDESHSGLTDLKSQGSLDKEIYEKFNHSKLISILYGKYCSPFIKIDPELISCKHLSNDALEAYEYILKVSEDSREEIVLSQGDIFLLNNHRLSHGRGAFSPTYDGQDRWLQRILSVDDLRKSIECRNSEFDVRIGS